MATNSTYLHLAPGTSPQAASALSTIKVVLADDHALVRRCLRLLLDEEEDFDVVGEAEDLRAATVQVQGNAPHVLILDLQMPGGSSIEAIRRLREKVAKTEIVVLTMEHSPAFAQRALDVGAIALVIKDRADTELSEAVRRAARGEEYVSPQVASGVEVLRRMRHGNNLSPREEEVLRLIALGYNSAEIAHQLHVSLRTIETQRASVHRKLQLRTRAQLVHFALRRHLVEP